MSLRNSLKLWRRYCAALVLVVPAVFVLSGQVFAATYDFASVGAVVGEFKPQGNRFLVSKAFENDSAPNTTAIWYNNVSAPDPRTVNGMIIKADGTNLTSFDLTGMKFTIYADATGTEDIASLKVTGTKVDNSTVSVTVNPPSTAPGASFTLEGLASLSAFTSIAQLSFDITTNNAVYNIDFSTITLANEVYPTINPPTTQATNAQTIVIGSTELNLGWISGNGGSRVVFAKQGVTTGAPSLVNGATYAANADFSLAGDPDSDGWKCVYNGNGSFAFVSGLAATTQYRFVVFEYNGSSGNEKYLATVAGNAFNQTTGGSLGVWSRGDIQTLNAENFWTWTDAARDSSGNSYVAHRYSGAGYEMRVEKWNGSAWSTLTSFNASSAGYTSIGDYSSIAVQGTDNLRLAIQGGSGSLTSSPRGVIHATYQGGSWSFQNVEFNSDPNGWKNTYTPVISVDGNGNSHILYDLNDANTHTQYIKLASWNGSGWTYQALSTIPNSNSYNEVKHDYLLISDSNNKQHIFYFRETAMSVRDLHYWTNSSGSATDTTIFTGSTDSPYKLYGAIDSSGKFHITYGEDALLGRKVMYLTNKTGSWAIQPFLISTAGWQKGFTPLELAINGNGDMVIPVRSQGDKVFKALLKKGSNPWQITSLSAADIGNDWEDVGFNYNSSGATFRDDGKVLIAFANSLDSRPRKLLYAVASLTPPTVTGISPTSGPTAGGTSVTVTGTGFENGATVTIGGASATGVTWNSAISISATTPAGTAGAKNVVVTNPDTQTGTLTNGFTYIANVTPAFVGAVTTLTVNQNSSNNDIKGLLHVSDPDAGQTETWTVTGAPSHGSLSGFPATASSGSADITPGGVITYTPTAGYSGSDSFTVQVSDGTATATRTITVTVVAPPTTTVSTASLSADTGSSGTDWITKTASQTINGTLSANLAGGETVEVSYDNGSTWANTTTFTVGSSAWSTVTTLSGSNTFKARVTNSAGSSTPYSHVYVLDTVAPTTTVTTVAFSADTGISSADFITRTAAQTISGTLSANLAAGEVVEVSLDNGATWTTATATLGQNSWSMAGQTLSGSNTLKVRVTDTAANSGPAYSQAYVLDTTAPSTTSVSVPTSSTYTTGQNLDFTVNWSENITVTGTDSTMGLTIGSSARLATYLSKTTASIAYRYTVQSGDMDNDGIAVGALTLNGSTIKDLAGNDAELTLNSVGATTGVLVDSMIPTATAATFLTISGFTAHWNSVAGATGYYLDIATDNGFTNILAGYNNKDVGNVTSLAVTGLSASTPFFYLVRSYSAGGTSGSSNTINPTTGKTLVVTNNLDYDTTVPGSAIPGSLRKTIADAGPGDEISFAAAVTGAINLVNTSGALVINKDLSILGPGAAILSVSGGNAVGIFQVTGINGFTLKNLTLANGVAIGGGAIADDPAGTTNTTIDRCVFSNNQAGSGGAIFTSGAMSISSCAFSGNSATMLHGGAIFTSGGIMTIGNTLFNGNSAPTGGAIANGATSMSLTNVTMNYNSATAAGGGIFTAGALDIRNSTIAGNSVLDALGQGGGLAVSGTPLVTLKNSIVADNTAAGGGPDIIGSVTSQGYNLVRSTAGATINSVASDITGQDPKLGVLAANGGPTRTMALLSGSPAIDAIPGCNGAPATDQRSMPRPQNSACDMGAFELGVATHFAVSAPATATAGASFSVTVTALDALNATATSYTGIVHFTGSDGAAILPADGTLTNGVGVFTVTLNTAGSQTVTATDKDISSIAGTSGAITVVGPPVITKSFGAASIPLNGSTSLSFTVQNNNSSTALTGVAFNDTLPAGLVVSSPNGLTGSCGGGTITAIPVTGVISLSGATLAASSSCTFSVNVIGTAEGLKNNITGNVTSIEGGSGNTTSATIDVVAPPIIVKVFGATIIALNGTTSLTFTLTNPVTNGSPATGVAFTDTLPTGLVVATPNGLSNTCNGAATAVAGSGSVSLSGGSIAVGASCTVAVNVTGTTSGVKNNTTGNISSTNGGVGATASATMTVALPPAIVSSFTAPYFAYITNLFSCDVSVIETVSDSVVGPAIPVDSSPFGVSAQPDGGTIYVTNQSSNSLSVIDRASMSVATTILFGGAPAGVAVHPDGSRVYVARSDSAAPLDVVSVIDAASKAVIATITVGSFPNGIAVHPSGSRVYVANMYDGTISVIDTASNTVSETITVGGGPYGISVHPDGGKAYVTNLSSNTVSVIRTSDNSIIKTVSVGSGPYGIAVHPDGSKVYVTNADNNTISVIRTSDDSVIKTFDVIGSSPVGIAVHPDGGKFYVTNYNSNTVSVFSTADDSVIKTFAVGSLPVAFGQFIASGPAAVARNGTNRLSFTLQNPNSGFPLTGVAFTDNLPAGLQLAAVPNLTSTCGGTVTADPDATSISLAGGALAAESTCSISVDVAGVTAGVKSNSVQASAIESGAGNTSNAAITVIGPSTIATAFGAASIPLNGSTSLTFTIQNNNTSTVLTGVAFNDTLPAGLVVTTPNGLSGSCGGGIITATAGTNVISLSGASLVASSSCIFSVNVTGTTAGTKTNTTGAITSTEGGTGGTATASIDVVAPPVIAKAFGAPGIALNGTTTLTFTLTNPAANPAALTGVAFTDNLPAGLVVATPNGLTNSCSGTPTAVAGSTGISLTGGSIAVNSSCTVVVNVTGVTAGTKNNTTGNVSSTNGGTGTTSNTATLTVATSPTITNVFGAASIPLNGSTSLTFTLTNPNATIALTGLAFSNTLPAGLVVATPSGLSSTCGGTATAVAGSGSVSLTGGSLASSTSCTVSINVQGTTAGVKNNGVQVSSTETGPGNTATASVTVMAPPALLATFDAQNLAYITNSADNTVSVLDLTTNAVVGQPVAVGALPGGVALLPDGSRAFIANYNDDTVSVIDAATNRVSATVTVPSHPRGMAALPDGSRLYVANFSAGTVSAIDTATNTVIAVIPVGAGPAGIAASADGRLVYVTNNNDNTISVIDAVTCTVLGSPLAVGSQPAGIVQTGSRLFVVNNGGNTVTVLDTATSTVIATIPVGAAPVGIAAHPDGSRVYVANYGDNSVSVLDTATNTVVATIPVGNHPSGVSVSPDGSHVYAVNTGDNSVTVIRTSDNSVVGAPLSVGSAPLGFGAFTRKSAGLLQDSTVRLTFTVTNPNPTTTLTGIGFSDTLNRVIATPSGLSGSCGGTITATPGSSVITLAGATLAANGSCTFSVNVAAGAAGTLQGLSTAITSNENGNGATAAASVTVAAPPAIAAAFTPATIGRNGVSALTLTLTNPAANVVQLLGVGVSTTLPAGLTVATSPGLASSCGGSATAVAGGSSIVLTGGSLAAGGSCTVTANVTGATSGPYTVTTGAVASGNGGTGATASATLTINKTVPVITWANPAAISYGTPLSGVQLNAVASVAGSFTYWPAAGTVLAAGSHTLTATFTPTDTTNYTVATWNVTIDVLKLNQAITFAPFTTPVRRFAAPFTLSATATSGLAVSFTSSDSNVATVSGSSVTVRGTGTCVITARQGGNDIYAAAPDVSLTLTVRKDDTLPLLVLSTLADNDRSGRAVLNVAGQASDPAGIAQVTVNGENAPLDRDGCFSVPVILAAGDNSITATAVDNDGNQSAVTRRITLESGAPQLTILTPTDNSVSHSAQTTLAGSVGSPAAVVSYSINGGTPRELTLSGVAFTVPVTLASGLNTIEVTAVDAGGSVSVKRSVTLKGSLSLFLIDPETDIRTGRTVYLLKGGLLNAAAPVNVTIAMDGTSYTTTATDGFFSQELPLTTEGNHVATITAEDGQGRTASMTRNLIYSRLGDADGDGLTIADALTAYLIHLGQRTATAGDLTRLDVAPLDGNGRPAGNGVIDTADVVLILRHIVGLAPW